MEGRNQLHASPALTSEKGLPVSMQDTDWTRYFRHSNQEDNSKFAAARPFSDHVVYNQ
jgi:hypothetical protein